jgi:hypothetical protein
MSYLNYDVLDGASAIGFQSQAPYPWVRLQDTLTEDGWRRLRENMPDIAEFNIMKGVKRAYGQAPHDRGILHYCEGVDYPAAWKEFIDELQGDRYKQFVRRMLQLPPDKEIILTMEWYYAWQGCSVSPHCDARRKAATHIFFFADDSDWPRAWGGDILILDDEGRWKAHSAPTFDDLKVAASLDLRMNASCLFARTEHSWHGVRPLTAPSADVFRKLFIVTVNLPTLQVIWRRMRGKDPDGVPYR